LYNQRRVHETLEAEEELKGEADKADIRFLPMASIPEIANYLLAVEERAR